ncbi:glycosyl hydrolase family 61-domain-containing protein [Xylariomycetidae sp. FL0641]|nr:glycosyl hydrolase family 61-domain-containing protein [Xylariomycetidae sp. FL0641]
MHTFGALLSLAALARAHYTFDQLVVNDELVGSANTYIRAHERSYYPTQFADILADDFRCNLNAAAAPGVMDVVAGDRVALKQAYGGTGMAHPGPAQVYMSRAPGGDVTAYAGDGAWFKVHQSLLCTPAAGDPAALRAGAWCSYGEDRIEFPVPATLPDGEYLVRAEHLALHGAHAGESEAYYACAQVRVSGNAGAGAEVPGPTTPIPALYDPAAPELNFSLWGAATDYPYVPGIAVAPGGTTRGSADGAAGDVLVEAAAAAAGGSGSVDTGAAAAEEEEAVADTPASVETGSGSGGAAAMYEQCGGGAYTGPTACAEGTCTPFNEWYSQCL